MKSFVALFALVAVAVADVSHIVGNPEAGASIVSQRSDVAPDGFDTSYETSNGILAQERGVLQKDAEGNAAIAVEGSNEYTAPGGERIQLRFVADEFGYRAEGAHLPVPPPTQAIPEYILRSIAYNAANAPKDVTKY